MAFVRVVKTKSSTGEIQGYVRVVENRRERGRSVQHVIANLGNVKVLKKDIKKIINGLLRAVGELPMVAAEDCRAFVHTGARCALCCGSPMEAVGTGSSDTGADEVPTCRAGIRALDTNDGGQQAL